MVAALARSGHTGRIGMFSLLVVSLFSVVVEAGTLRASTSPFLYAGNAYPVVEYMASGGGEGEDEPDFLYSTDQGYRLVEFYAKTDAVSIRMKESYIRTANAVREIAQSQNVSVDTYAVSCTAVPALCEVQGMENYPVFLLYKPGSIEGVRLEKLSAATVLEKFGLQFSDADTTKQLELLETVESHPMRTLEELKADIHLSFDTAMRHHIYGDVNEPLSKERRAALKSWLLLIHKTIPPAWHIHAIVKELINSFMYVTKNKAYMIAILDVHKPTVTDYSKACNLGHTTGVTCGAWEMIHAVTVGAVEYNKMGLLEKKNQISTEAAARIIREYVYYFGMGDDPSTRGHFLSQLDACQESHCLQPKKSSSSTRNSSISSSSSSKPGLTDWIQLPLWISQTHTNINHKLQLDHAVAAGTKTTLKQHMTAVWPPRKFCPDCWNKAGKWNQDVVYKYLQLEYTQIEELSPETREEIFGMALPREFGSGFPALDNRQAAVILFAVGILVTRFLCVRGRTLSTAKKD